MQLSAAGTLQVGKAFRKTVVKRAISGPHSGSMRNCEAFVRASHLPAHLPSAMYS